jgi:hypothetical protein
MTADPIVCCVKWGTKYPAIYANRLRRMVRRHLAHPHDFVCLTDDPGGLDADIATIRLPDADFAGFWNKISLFRADLFEPGRTVIYLDVDVVIVGPLDFMLEETTADLTIARGFSKNLAFNSSVMRFRAGTLAHVYERFANDAEAIVASGRFSGDQNWIHEQVPDAAFFPRGRIVSYKRDMRSHVFLQAKKLGFDSWLKAPRWMTVKPPAGASIVVFHGKPDPEDVMDSPYGPWKRAPFVKEHWR